MVTYQALKERCAKTYYKALFTWRAKAILQTTPVARGDLQLTTLSMVHTRDVIPYLIAFKSFHRQIPARNAVVICDPTITPADRQVLRAHIPHIELRDAAEFTHPSIPRGGTWERLFAISDYATRDYVIQLDADTIATGLLPEVESRVVANRAFVIGEIVDQRVDPLAVFSERARANPNPHVQNRAEAALDNLGLPPETRYVRGCSGFTGFPKNTDMRERLVDFSERMRGKLGTEWNSWGTEQVTSNFVVANLSDARVLPYPRYASSHHTKSDSVFFHFIGSVRFRNRHYERVMLDVLRDIESPRILESCAI